MGRKIAVKKKQPRKPAILNINFVKAKNKEEEGPILQKGDNDLDFQSMVFEETIEAIEDFTLYPKNETYLFEIKKLCVYVTLDKKFFPRVLLKALQFYEKKENYEMCSRCQKLLTTIKV